MEIRQQPLSQKSKFFVSSPYTGEPLLQFPQMRAIIPPNSGHREGGDSYRPSVIPRLARQAVGIPILRRRLPRSLCSLAMTS